MTGADWLVPAYAAVGRNASVDTAATATSSGLAYRWPKTINLIETSTQQERETGGAPRDARFE
ncbi:hypothetical protein Raf01_80000 [Rugosimonospora africana]|uniref:Uncharacterized protein n=1 Tax=Rugosimonospora africana TaxID=556532 RepID=A0A8J3VVL1_9ACTN|nr:hypothetical protein Raf01_80000 [Rugosimonospora africana]